MDCETGQAYFNHSMAQMLAYFQLFLTLWIGLGFPAIQLKYNYYEFESK